MIKYLVIGPGGMVIFPMVGFLSTSNVMSTIEEISGSSAGAILGYLMCFCTPHDAFQKLMDTDMKTLSRPSLKNIFTSFGFISLSKIRDTLMEWNGDPTFKELYESSKKKLHVSTLCLNTGETTYFSCDTSPDMKVLDALCMSIAVPFLFDCFHFDKQIFIDGGTLEVVPDKPFIDKDPKDVFTLQLFMDIDTSPPTSLFQYILMLMNIIWNSKRQSHITCRKVVVKMKKKDIFRFHMSSCEKRVLFDKGSSIGSRFLLDGATGENQSGLVKNEQPSNNVSPNE